jgi:hypothetical protein
VEENQPPDAVFGGDDIEAEDLPFAVGVDASGQLAFCTNTPFFAMCWDSDDR